MARLQKYKDFHQAQNQSISNPATLSSWGSTYLFLEEDQKKLDKALKRNLQTQKVEDVPKIKENQENITEEIQQ